MVVVVVAGYRDTGPGARRRGHVQGPQQAAPYQKTTNTGLDKAGGLDELLAGDGRY